MGRMINVAKMIESLDYYVDRKEYDKAEAHLSLWLQESRMCGDYKGQLSVLNEQLGLYRKCGKKKECYDAINRALTLLEDPSKELESTVVAGTTYLNIATAYKVFDEILMSIKYYEKASKIYEETLDENDPRMAGLLNNFALTLVVEKRYVVAKKQYDRAIEICLHNDMKLDAALTYINLADMAVAVRGFTDAEELTSEFLGKAIELIDDETVPRNGYYAFVCEKLAPVFGYYGYFMYESILKERAAEVLAELNKPVEDSQSGE